MDTVCSRTLYGRIRAAYGAYNIIRTRRKLGYPYDPGFLAALCPQAFLYFEGCVHESSESFARICTPDNISISTALMLILDIKLAASGL